MSTDNIPISPNLVINNYKYTIVLLTSILSDNWNFLLYNGILNASKRENVNVIQIDCGQLNSNREKANISTILTNLVTAHKFQGLIAANSFFNNQLPAQEFTEDLKNFKSLPIVTIDTQIKPHPCVKVDQYMQMTHLMEHLIKDHGYRKIFLFLRKKPGIKSYEFINNREKILMQAYCDTFAKYNIQVNEDNIIKNIKIFHESFEQSLLNLIKNKTEAVILPGRFGREAIKIYNRHNISVPEDIAIACYNRLNNSELVIPRITIMDNMLYKKGQKALQLLVQILDGKIPAEFTEPVVLNPQLIVKQSCGCNDHNFFNIKTAENTQKLSLTAIILKNRKKIIRQMQTNMPILKINNTEYNELLDAFILNLINHKKQPFLNVIEKILNHSLDDRDDPNALQHILSILAAWIQNSSIDQTHYIQATKIIYQGRIQIFQIARQKMFNIILKLQQRLTIYQSLKNKLETKLELKGLYQLLKQEFLKLNITTSFLVLYENPKPYKYPDPCPRWSRLVLAIIDKEQLLLENEDNRFQTNYILPDRFLHDINNRKLIIIPLYYNEQQIGYIIIELQNAELINYISPLQIGIACALNNILLLTKMQNHTKQITRQKHILDTFMETIPYSIYFKNKACKFINANPAYKKSICILQSENISGKDDFDFFPYDQAKERQHQDELVMQIGISLISITEKNKLNDKWELSTKMPLRDETGKIIGTFSIARDITEIKNAQMQLEDAYGKIKVLNEKLQTDNRRMKIELDLLRHLQQMILPDNKDLDKVSRWQISAFMQPADEVSGDYYDIIPKNRKLILGIGDVTGHGLESGVIMIMLQTALRSLVYVGESIPMKIYHTMNQFLYQNISKMNIKKMVTLLIVSFTENDVNLFGYHDEPFIITKNGKIKLISTMNQGIPIGIKADIKNITNPVHITLTPGDSIIFYTDGITEARSGKGKYYGLKRLQKNICKDRQKPLDLIKQNVLNDLHTFLGNKKIYDDIAFIIIKNPAGNTNLNNYKN